MYKRQINLCLWCPAHAALETGNMDDWVEYFCAVAHERARAIGGGEAPGGEEALGGEETRT